MRREVKLKDRERPTSKSCELLDLDGPLQPFPGQRVFALTLGGRLIETVWSERERGFYDAWCQYPDVPHSVKEKQNMRIHLAMLQDGLKLSGAPTLAELTERFSSLSPEQIDTLEFGVVE
jgi:hypothetical protein